MAIFKARIDMINAHRGHAGYHPGHLKYTFDRITVEKGLTIAGVLKLPPDDQDDLKNEIEAVVSEEYPAVLFIKQADEIRYGELKNNLGKCIFEPILDQTRIPQNAAKCAPPSQGIYFNLKHPKEKQ